MSILVRRPRQKKAKAFFISPKKIKLRVLSQDRFKSFIRPPRIEDCFQVLTEIMQLHPYAKTEAIRERPKVDDTLSRLSLWKAMFGDEEMPEVESGAAEKYAGTLDKYLIPGFDFDKIIRRIRKGST